MHIVLWEFSVLLALVAQIVSLLEFVEEEASIPVYVETGLRSVCNN